VPRLSPVAPLVLTVLGIAAAVQVPVQRTVYITAAAADGSALSDIAPADLRIKENGQACKVLRVDHSRSALQIAIVVEELLTPDDEVRKAIANFVDQVRGAGEIALYVVGRRTEKRVDYTSGILPFANAINRFAVRSGERGDIVQALHEVAREQRPREGRRAVVAVAVEGAQVSNVTAAGVLDQLAASGAVLYAATLAGSDTSTAPAGATSAGRRLDLEAQVSGLERDRVLNDGPRQSGGLRLPSTRTAGLWATMERIAAELRRQYVVSYEGNGRPGGSLAIDAVRSGVVVRGPSRAR